MDAFKGEREDVAVINYVDDLWFFSNEKRGLHDLMLYIESFGLEIRKNKTVEYATSFEYGGFRFADGQYSPIPSVMTKIADAKMPGTTLQWQRFFGSCNFIADHVPEQALIRRQIQELLPVTPTSKDEIVPLFEKMKSVCLTPLKLDIIKWGKPLYLVGDTGKLGTAFALVQEFDPDLEYPLESPALKKIGFYSGAVAEFRGEPNAREQAGLNAAAKHFQKYLHFTPVKFMLLLTMPMWQGKRSYIPNTS